MRDELLDLFLDVEADVGPEVASGEFAAHAFDNLERLVVHDLGAVSFEENVALVCASTTAAGIVAFLDVLGGLPATGLVVGSRETPVD